MKNRFHRRGGWNDDVVVFFYIFNSDVSPVELRIFQEARSRKNPPEKNVSWQGFDEGDRQWRWTYGIQGEVLHVAESWTRASPPPEVQRLMWTSGTLPPGPTTVHSSIR
jgi:hypothetical protein